MSGNTDLWKLVEKTDPAAVRPITGKPYNGNSPKPHWLFYRATEVFGPCGIGWGVEIVSERIEGGAGEDKVHVAHVRVWYIHEGQRGVVEHVGQTMFSGRRKQKQGQSTGDLYTDEDAPKKSVTDATVKALSMIGFAGDIFSGRWDDSKYVAEIRQEFIEQRQQDETPSVGVYTKRCFDKIDSINQRQALIEWWSSEKGMRAALGLNEGTENYAKLFDAYKRRGTQISVSNATAFPGDKTRAA